jgi:hypothetical protein
MMWFMAAILLIMLACVEVGAFLTIPHMAKIDQEVWLKGVLKQKPSSYTRNEYIVQCLFEFIIFNSGVLIGIALGWVSCKI